MADVYTVLFIVLGILLSFPALLIAINLLIPLTVKRAEVRLRQTPGRCFALGLPIVGGIGFVVAATSSGPLRAIGFVLLAGVLFLAAVGSAAMSRLLGQRLSRMSNPNSELTHLLRGAVVYELATLVPVLGWFLFFPIMTVLVTGASAFAFLRWMPRVEPEAQPQPSIRVQVDNS